MFIPLFVTNHIIVINDDNYYYRYYYYCFLVWRPGLEDVARFWAFESDPHQPKAPFTGSCTPALRCPRTSRWWGPGGDGSLSSKI